MTKTTASNVAHAEGYITLGQAAALLPHRPGTNALWRWCRRGLTSRSGERVYLEHRRAGKIVVTTREWLDDFMRRLSESDAPQLRRSAPAAESDDHRAAVADLTKQGLVGAGT